MIFPELDTPAVLVDLDALGRNITRMAAYARDHGLQIRPHIKTHKNIEIAKQQVAAGACGLTVAKPGEAEVMAAGGITDLLVAYPIVNAAKARRVADVARNCSVRVSLDSELAVRCLAEAAGAAGVEIGVLIEIDVGFGRCGLQSAADSAALARVASSLRGLRVDGLMFYPGHIKAPLDQQTPLIEDVNRKLR